MGLQPISGGDTQSTGSGHKATSKRHGVASRSRSQSVPIYHDAHQDEPTTQTQTQTQTQTPWTHTSWGSRRQRVAPRAAFPVGRRHAAVLPCCRTAVPQSRCLPCRC